jgi:AcrR family transcriptional regulator
MSTRWGYLLTMRQKRAEGVDTRSALLEAAAGLLEGGGMEAVTLRSVGERAGVSRQAPYRHFADKDALLSVLAAGYYERLGREMEGAVEEAGDDALSRLDAVGAAYVDFALANPHRYRLMLGAKMRSSPHPEAREAADAVYERFVRIVAECQEAGRLPAGDPVELADLVYATSHGAVDLALSGSPNGSKDAGAMRDPLSVIRLLLDRLHTG